MSPAPSTKTPDPPARNPIDLLIIGAAELATPLGTSARRGPELRALRVLPRGAVAIDGGRITAVGPEPELLARFEPRRTLDAAGGTLVPGFVDAHTHPIFATTREGEFELRTRGAGYVEIAQAGGGIGATARGVRAASSETLERAVALHLQRFLELGTTTVEAKSGYGLSTDAELKSLRALRQAAQRVPVHVVPTFLGAHDVPAEHRADPARYVDLIAEEMLPRVASEELAAYCDVFTEAHTFGLAASRRILSRARELGLGLRLHVDQLSPLGGAELAVELGAASADHLEHVSPAGLDALAASATVAVLCPLVPICLRQDREAPGRALADRGAAVCVSTDFNPGSCMTQSLPLAMGFAALRYRFLAGEALTAATLNAAASLGLAHEIGTLEAGKRADVLVLDVPSHQFLVYELGRNPVRAVVAQGRIAWRRAGDDPALAR
jgi:imidazolonepropionase